MDRFRKPALAASGALALLLLLVLAVAAGASFSGVSGPVLDSGNWEWTGTATVTVPQNYVCVTFPGSLVPSVACTGDISGEGATPFTCSVPATAFDGIVGSIDWQISAFPSGNCSGAEIEGPDGTFTPTAVSLLSLGSVERAGMPFAAVLFTGLLLLSGAFLWRRERLARR